MHKTEFELKVLEVIFEGRNSGVSPVEIAEVMSFLTEEFNKTYVKGKVNA